MKLGLGSYACAWGIGVPGFEPGRPLDARGLIARAAALGLSLIQIADNIPLERLSRGELDGIRDLACDHGIEVEVGTRGIAPDHLRRCLELCSLFGSPILRVVIDTSTHHPPISEVLETLGGMMPAFDAAGVVLAIENHDRFDSRMFASIIEQLGTAHAGICLDTVNSFGALEGPAVVIATLARYVVNLHVKDFVMRRHPSMMGFEITGAPAGQGRLDIPCLLATLRENGRNPNAILELWPTPEPDIEATVDKEREWAEASVRYLRTLIPE